MYGRFSLQILSDQIYKYVFLVFAIGGSQVYHLKIYCGFDMEPRCFHVCVYQHWPQTPAATWRNMGFCDVFMLCPPGKIYPGLSYSTKSHFDPYFCEIMGKMYSLDATISPLVALSQRVVLSIPINSRAEYPKSPKLAKGLQKETDYRESMELVAILDLGKILKVELNLHVRSCLSKKQTRLIQFISVIFCHFHEDLHCWMTQNAS